ncbi:MAG: DUF523 domain-containing protein [Romboutsia sp.]
MIAVSACLLGINCKYNGDNNKNQEVINYLIDKNFILICPEQLGGLSTPRDSSEIIDLGGQAVLYGESDILSNKNKIVTENFIRGAKESLKIAQMYNCKEAILKEGSPSCGSSVIYDGTFRGKKISGEGVTTSLFRMSGIKVISEKEL